MRRWAIGLAGFAMLWCVVAAALFENATQIAPTLRPAPSLRRARTLAEQSHARVSDVQIAAGDGAILRGWLFEAEHPNGIS